LVAGTIDMSVQDKKFAIAGEDGWVGLGKARPFWHDEHRAPNSGIGDRLALI
jgi:hypothetical protein